MWSSRDYFTPMGTSPLPVNGWSLCIKQEGIIIVPQTFFLSVLPLGPPKYTHLLRQGGCTKECAHTVNDTLVVYTVKGNIRWPVLVSERCKFVSISDAICDIFVLDIDAAKTAITNINTGLSSFDAACGSTPPCPSGGSVSLFCLYRWIMSVWLEWI